MLELSFLPKKQVSENTLIQKDADPEKYSIIASKLCDKRKALEEELKNQNLEQSLREERAISLLQLKESMRTFGVSEIDYQTYLAYLEKEKEQAPPSLF
jgi:hypothetical protein